MEIPSLDAWKPWHPQEAARRLEGLAVPWYVAGGWALDLWHGRETRPHEDLEIAVPRSRFERVRRHFSEFRFYSAGSGEVWPCREDVEAHQRWLFDEPAGVWRMDVFLEPGDDETWICRRDENLRLPRTSIATQSADGIPYLKPEFVLLFKAKATRAKDEEDFTRALPHLSGEARAWLRWALARIQLGHLWLDLL